MSGLTELTELDLSDNDVMDISALSGLTELTELDLSDNDISDISALSGLTALTTLDLRGNPIADISVLDGLPNLNTVYYPTIVFQNTGLAGAVRRALGLASGDDIEIRQLQSLTSLVASAREINNLNGLQFATASRRWIFLITI